MNTLKLLRRELDESPESVLREVYHYLLFLRSKAPHENGIQAGEVGGDALKIYAGGQQDDGEWRDAYELGKQLFGQFAPSEPPADPLKRRIWERLHEQYGSR